MGICEHPSLSSCLVLGALEEHLKGCWHINLVAAEEAMTPLGSCATGTARSESPGEPVKRAAEPSTREAAGDHVGCVSKGPRQTQGGLLHPREQPLVKLRKTCSESQHGRQQPGRQGISVRWGLRSQPKKPTEQLT